MPEISGRDNLNNVINIPVVKKITSCMLAISAALSLLAGCGNKTPETVETAPETTVPTTVAETTETTPETSAFVTYTAQEYRDAGVNELNSVPILMYHRIYGMTNAETSYTGGNVDKDGRDAEIPSLFCAIRSNVRVMLA